MVVHSADLVYLDLIRHGLRHGLESLVPDQSLPAAVREFVADEEFFGSLVTAFMMFVYTSIAVVVGFASGSAAGRLRSSVSSVDRSIQERFP